ncbi:Transposase OS=Castellaniella defragrans OX=75697 GN=HNR28_000546 PE=4 SV=1 [Castellaniella denitrificans]
MRQTTERGHKVADVAARLGVSTWSLYQWRKQYAGDEGAHRNVNEQFQEVRRLKAELRRVTEERDILKKAAAYFAKQSQ